MAKRPLKSQSVRKPVKKKSSAGAWIVGLLLICGAGGGAYYYMEQQAEKARIEQEKRLAAEEAARLKAKKQAEERARKAAEEAERRRREAEEAERRRREEEERRRREEEERRKQQETDDEPEPEPEPEPEEPTDEPSRYDADVDITGGTSKEDKEAFQAMLEGLIQDGDYAAFSKSFTAKILEGAKTLMTRDELNYNAYRNSPTLVTAMDLCLLIDYAGEDTMKAITSPEADNEAGYTQEKGREFMKWLLTDRSRPLHSLMQHFMLHEGVSESMPHAIDTYYRIWLDTPKKDLQKYRNLAIACALVHPKVANSEGRLRNPTKPLLDMVQVNRYFREKDAKRKLEYDLKKMDVRLLLNVVDIRLTQSEIDWVEKNVRYKKEKWVSEALGSIRYRMDKAANGVDPYTHYTFAELRQEGGVCGDQAYFAINTAKCAGIPAIYASGDGPQGGHAWAVAFLGKDNWEEVNSLGYKTGTYADTCSGRPHHVSMLLNKKVNEKESKLMQAADCMGFARFMVSNGAVAEARAAARFVTRKYPLLTSAWVNLISVLEDERGGETPTADWRRAYNDLMRHGKKNTELLDLAGEVQSDYLLSDSSASGRKNLMAQNLRKLKKQVGDGRADLLLDAVQRQGDLLAEEGDKKGLMKLYKEMLDDFAHRPDIFGKLLNQYDSYLDGMEDMSKREWAAVVRMVDKIFEKKVWTDSTDHFRLSKEVNIQKRVAGMYEKAGNQKKADKMKEEGEARLSESKDKYQPEEED